MFVGSPTTQIPSRDAAIKVAIAAASEVISAQLSATEANKLIDSGISEIESKLH